MEDLQAEQEQRTQALSGVARHQPIHPQPVQEKHKKYLEKGPKDDQKYLQKEQETHLEKFLKQRRQLGKNESERFQQIIGVPKRQYCEKHEDDERQDHNTYTFFEFRYNQGNNKVQIEAQVCCVHEAEEE